MNRVSAARISRIATVWVAVFVVCAAAIAHQNTKAAMEELDEFKGAGARFPPNRTVTDRLSLSDGSDHIGLYCFGAGHTSGDFVAVLPAKRVA